MNFLQYATVNNHLSYINEQEILDSTDCDDIRIEIGKISINEILKLFTVICNLLILEFFLIAL